MTGDPGVTPESLDFEWGDAYLICYARDQWAALRRDTRRFLTAQTLDELAAQIDTDYAAHPVPRDVDPPGTADHLDTPDENDHGDDAPDEDEDDGGGGGGAPDEDEDDGGGGAPGRDGDRPELLIRLREAFPQWAISYAPFSRAWTARKRRRHHLPEHPRPAVLRPHADRAQGTPGPARPRPGLAPLGPRAPLIDPRPAPRAAAPREPLYAVSPGHGG